MRAAKLSRDLGNADWRLPSRAEASAIVGSQAACKAQIPRRAVSPVLEAIRDDGLVGSYWLTSLAAEKSAESHFADFDEGGVDSIGRPVRLNVRLIRGGKPASAEEFRRDSARVDSSEAQHSRSEEKQAVEDARRDQAAAIVRAQQERAQAAANAANEARRNAEACGRLYAGKPVRFPGGEFWGRRDWVDAVIMGVGSGVASARVIGGTSIATGDGYGIGTVHERSCTEF